MAGPVGRAISLIAVLLIGPMAVAETEPCRPIPGLDPLLTHGRVLLLGEIHGTDQAPRFTLDVVCAAAAADLPVIVGLEIPTREQPLVDRFLASTGAPGDRPALLRGSHWQSDYQDGRGSAAMADLLDGLRRLRQQGRKVRVVLFDSPGGGEIGRAHV